MGSVLCTKYIVFGDFRILVHSFSEPSHALKPASQNKMQKAQAYSTVETRPWICIRTKTSNPTARIGLAWAYDTNAGSGRFPGPVTTSGLRVFSACKEPTSFVKLKKSLWAVQQAQLDEQVGTNARAHTHTHTNPVACLTCMCMTGHRGGAGGGLKTLFLDWGGGGKRRKDTHNHLSNLLCVCACVS